MPKTLTDLELIRELEPVAEAGMNQHLAATRNWNPHDYVPWSDGSDYGALGGHDWSLDESRHGIALRDYLVVTRAVDPNALEMARIGQVTAGFSPGQQGQGSVRPETMLDALVYVTFQELATRVSHRNTGRACDEPIADQLLKRVSADENLHMIFYRGVGAAAMDIAPDAAMQSVCRILKNFQMPGFTIPNFRRNAVKIAVGGIYDLRQHLDEVVLPVLRYWRIFERDDFTGVGQRNRDDLADFLAQTDVEAAKFEQSKARYLERGAARLERALAKTRVS